MPRKDWPSSVDIQKLTKAERVFAWALVIAMILTSCAPKLSAQDQASTQAAQLYAEYLITQEVYLAATNAYLETPGNLDKELDRLDPSVVENTFGMAAVYPEKDTLANTAAYIGREGDIGYFITGKHCLKTFIDLPSEEIVLAQPKFPNRPPIHVSSQTMGMAVSAEYDVGIFAIALPENFAPNGLEIAPTGQPFPSDYIESLGIKISGHDPSSGQIWFDTLPIIFDSFTLLDENDPVEALITDTATQIYPGESGSIAANQAGQVIAIQSQTGVKVENYADGRQIVQYLRIYSRIPGNYQDLMQQAKAELQSKQK